MTISAPLFICLVIVACLTAVATAIRSVSRIWLRHWAERRLRGAPSVDLYLERLAVRVAARGSTLSPALEPVAPA